MANARESAEWKRLFCKLCQQVTRHMDFRPLPVQFKCMECGEYNQIEESNG